MLSPDRVVPPAVSSRFWGSGTISRSCRPTRHSPVRVVLLRWDVYTGLLIGYRLRVPPGLPVTWWTEIKHVEAPHRFVDEQRFGPYALWYHEHHFRAVDGGVEMTDTVHYALPGGWLGRLAHSLFVGRQVRGIFEHRTKVLEKLAAEEGLVPATAGDTRGP